MPLDPNAGGSRALSKSPACHLVKGTINTMQLVTLLSLLCLGVALLCQHPQDVAPGSEGQALLSSRLTCGDTHTAGQGTIFASGKP